MAFPKPPTKAVCLDWNVPDPSAAAGGPAEIESAYDRAYQALSSHIRDLVQAVLGESLGT